MRKSTHNLPTDVYRIYDNSGRLLYVGISAALTVRFKSHRRYARWWGLAARTVVETYRDRSEAAYIEARSIEHDSPAFNVRPELRGKPAHLPVPMARFELGFENGQVVEHAP